MFLTNENHHKFNLIGKYIFVIAILLAITIWGCTSPKVSSNSDIYIIEYFHEGWSQQVGDALIPLDDIHSFEPVDVGESLIFTCTLPEIEDGEVFLFYSIDKEVQCYVGDTLIQNFTMQEGYSFLDTPGSAWNQVDLDRSMSGKTFTIIFHSPLGNYNSLCNIYLIDAQYVNTVRLENIWLVILSIFSITSVMMVILFTGIVAKIPHRVRYLLSIAQYFSVVLAWLLAEVNAYDLIFMRPIISYLLGEVFRYLLPLALLYLAKNSTNNYWHPRLLNSLRVLAWTNFIGAFILQFVFDISLLELNIARIIISSIINICLLFIVAEKFLHFKTLHYEEYPCLILPVLILLGGVDTTILFLNKGYHPFLGVWTAVGCITFSVLTLLLLTDINARIVSEKEEIEQTCRDLENNMLSNQIEAHFIFNVLNTISAYYKTDPGEADFTIKTFASYLRTYLSLITRKDNIPFQKELDLVKDYLIIQQKRFGENVSFVFHNEYMDFELPPFSVYTLVENSVIHGIKNNQQDGTITISTKKEGDFVHIIIADNGAGFDTSILTKTTSVGLSNTIRRMEIMSHATITIESSIGIGTKTLIMLPIEVAKGDKKL